MNEHDALIEQLCRDTRPVKRLAAPWTRAGGYMLVALPCGFLASLSMPQARPDWSAPGAPWAALWILTSFFLGALAIKTSFAISIAGQGILGRRRLAILSVVWLLVGLIDVTSSTDPVGHIGDGKYCYTFMLVAGMPMAVVALAVLRYTRSVRPTRSLASAGLGIAAMSQILLGFCHPVAGELVDLLMHLAATLTLIAVIVIGGRGWVKI